MFIGGTGSIYNVGNNTPWSIKIQPLDVETDIVFHIVGSGSRDTWSESDRLFVFWGQDFGVRVRNQNVSNIAIKFITLSGTITVTNNTNNVPVCIEADYIANPNTYIWINRIELTPPINNRRWSMMVPLHPTYRDISVWAGTLYQEPDSWLLIEEKTLNNVTGNIPNINFNIDLNSGGDGNWTEPGGGGGYNPPGGWYNPPSGGGGGTVPGEPVPAPPDPQLPGDGGGDWIWTEPGIGGGPIGGGDLPPINNG